MSTINIYWAQFELVRFFLFLFFFFFIFRFVLLFFLFVCLFVVVVLLFFFVFGFFGGLSNSICWTKHVLKKQVSLYRQRRRGLLALFSFVA